MTTELAIIRILVVYLEILIGLGIFFGFAFLLCMVSVARDRIRERFANQPNRRDVTE